MGNNYKYFIVKDRKDLSITCFEYDKVHGYDLNPRNIKIKDAIDVNKMIVINQSMIEKIAYKKVDSKYKKLLKIVTYLFDNNDDDDCGVDSYIEALNYIEKIRLELYVKYKNKLKEKDIEQFDKKISIIEQELKVRLMFLQNLYKDNYTPKKTGKSR